MSVQEQESNSHEESPRELKFSLQEIIFSDGTKVDIEQNETVFIVGPNNSGKSATLKEIELSLRSKSTITTVLKGINYTYDSSLDETTKYVRENCSTTINANRQPVYHIGNAGLADSSLPQVYNKISEGLGHLSGLVCKYLNTESRLTDSNPATRIDFKKTAMSNPIHFMEKNPSIEDEICTFFENAFSQPIYIDRNAGNVTPIVIGHEHHKRYKENRFNTNIMSEIGDLPRLEEQGDGMRSFVSILLSTKINQRKLVLIDEPEAFLHPIQIRLLGDTLTQRENRNFQTLISTHSGDLLRSAISKNDRKIKIIRLERRDNINIPKCLKKEDIELLWNDPLLKYSNILDGLFHNTTIICESDSDCRFYSAILETISTSDNSYPDILFTHCGGKHRIKVAAAALYKLGVRTKCICDIDILCEESTSKELLTVVGGDWSEIQKDWNILNSAIQQGVQKLSKEDAKDKILKILEESESKEITSGTQKHINDAIKNESLWKKLKKGGVESGILKGDAYRAIHRIIKEFKKHNIYIVQEGEAESFVKSEGSHGPEWVGKVLSNYDLKGDQLSSARQFMRDVCEGII